MGCDGSGKIPCADCKGRGYFWTLSPRYKDSCFTCKGNAKVDCPGCEDKDCPNKEERMSDKSYLEEKLEDDAFRATYYEQACKLNEDEITTLRKRVEELEEDKVRLSMLGGDHHMKMVGYRTALEYLGERNNWLIEKDTKWMQFRRPDPHSVTPSNAYTNPWEFASDTLKKNK